MKKKLLITFILSSTFMYAQSGLILSTSDISEGSIFFDKIQSQNTGKSLTYEEVLGSPYISNTFLNAKVAENYESIPVRYNTYTDEVEFQKEEYIYILPKEHRFSRIQITSPKQTLVLLENNSELSGYYFEIVNGKNKLYKKIKTKFIDVILGGTSYSSDTPASFKTLEPIYYILTDSAGIIKNLKNEKEIIKYFPEKKEILSSFIKEKNIKIKKEEDLIKLVNFLNQL